MRRIEVMLGNRQSMPNPILTSTIFDIVEGFFRMRRFRETPISFHIISETNNKNPLPLLWDTIICRIYHSEHDIVF